MFERLRRLLETRTKKDCDIEIRERGKENSFQLSPREAELDVHTGSTEEKMYSV